MTRKTTFAILAALLSLCSFQAFAQGSMSIAQMREIKSACKADVKAYCSAVQPGEGRLVMCLKENERSISEQCNKLLDSLISQQ
nr:cysteine rich repeat-containing protein [uncultured Cohaesibacter sp.]